MNEFRFRAYENPKTPESWIEKALDIPNNPPKQRRVPRSALIGSAAAVVIVAAALLTLGLHTDSPSPALQKSAVIAPSVPSNTESAAAPTVPSKATATTAGTAATTAATHHSEQADASGNAVMTTQAVRSLAAASTAPSRRRAASINPSSDNTAVRPSESTQSVTQTAKTPSPAKAPSKPQTTEPAAEPTQAPTEASWEASETGYYEGAMTFRMNPNSELYYGDEVYVHITHNGNAYSEKYSPAELAEVTEITTDTSKATKQVVIVPKKKGIFLQGNNSYQIELYNASGSSSTFSNVYIASD